MMMMMMMMMMKGGHLLVSVSDGLDGSQTDLPDGLIYNYLQPVKNAVSGDVRL